MLRSPINVVNLSAVAGDQAKDLAVEIDAAAVGPRRVSHDVSIRVAPPPVGRVLTIHSIDERVSDELAPTIPQGYLYGSTSGLTHALL